jgi:hypothetical protein
MKKSFCKSYYSENRTTATFNDNWVDLPSTISENDKHTAILNQYKTLSTKNNPTQSYYSENRTTDDDPIRTIVNYGRDVIRNHTECVNHYSLIDLITSLSILLNSKKLQTESALFLTDLQFKEKRETSLLELSQRSFERKKGKQRHG